LLLYRYNKTLIVSPADLEHHPARHKLVKIPNALLREMKIPKKAKSSMGRSEYPKKLITLYSGMVYAVYIFP